MAVRVISGKIKKRGVLMKNYLKKTIMAAFSVTLLTGLAVPSVFAQQSVKVNLPTFKITANDVAIDNNTRLYPVIVYKDTTYLPMTYNDSRFLGLETDWSLDKGLQITKNSMQLSYNPNNRYINSALEDAVISELKTSVNGKVINNKNETLPLLVFRDITYAPLMRYGVDEFNLTFSFDANKGLIINSKATKASSATIPADAKVYSQVFDNVTVILDRSWNNQSGNLYVKENNITKKIGNPNYIYGESYSKVGAIETYSPVNNLSVSDRWVYVVAIDSSASPLISKNVRVNIDTNEVQVTK
ncbi:MULTISPECIES: hypothetical protein [Pelosinus]|nr:MULTISPECIES: hypothetical protein [Pelosinus]